MDAPGPCSVPMARVEPIGPYNWKNYRLLQRSISAGSGRRTWWCASACGAITIDEDVWRLTKMMLMAFALYPAGGCR